MEEELRNVTYKAKDEAVGKPTPWLTRLVVVRKPNGKMRICLDPRDLNCAFMKSHYAIPTIEEILPDLGKVKVFITLDEKNGFWHVQDLRSSHQSSRYIKIII